MRRREFIRVIAVATVWPLVAHAQQTRKIAKIGVLWHAGSAEQEKVYLDALTKAFSDLGYVEGKDAVFLHRYPDNRLERYRELATDLIGNKADVIIAMTQTGVMALKQATSTIPIVFVTVVDPVGAGLIDSLAHPGHNLTGLSVTVGDLAGKRLGLFKEAVPTLSRVALLFQPNDPLSLAGKASQLNAAKPPGVTLHPVEVPTAEAIEPAFAAIAQDGFDGAVVTGAMMFDARVQVGASALACKMPTVTGIAEAVPSGLLLSYGPDYLDYVRKSATYVDKILKGAKPADLPVEQPTRLKLVINLRAAGVLGLTMPPTLLMAADEVIE
jgi:putative tryptophan/tyrosine transport system substrate-binding protein